MDNPLIHQISPTSDSVRPASLKWRPWYKKTRNKGNGLPPVQRAWSYTNADFSIFSDI